MRIFNFSYCVNEQEHGDAWFTHCIFGVAYYWTWLLMYVMAHGLDIQHYYYNYRKQYLLLCHMKNGACVMPVQTHNKNSLTFHIVF